MILVVHWWIFAAAIQQLLQFEISAATLLLLHSAPWWRRPQLHTSRGRWSHGRLAIIVLSSLLILNGNKLMADRKKRVVYICGELCRCRCEESSDFVRLLSSFCLWDHDFVYLLTTNVKIDHHNWFNHERISNRWNCFDAFNNKIHFLKPNPSCSRLKSLRNSCQTHGAASPAESIDPHAYFWHKIF